MSESNAKSADSATANARAWLLLGHKAGDNTQVLALAEALGWVCAQKRIRYRGWELLSNRLLRVTLAGVDRTASSALVPPWPELVISSGRRNEPVARWIKQQSGGRTRIVHIGRPWAGIEHFDLVVTTPQYRVPAGANVLLNDLPMHRLSPRLLEEAAQAWQQRLAHLGTPRIAVLLGGNSGAYVFTAAKAKRLGALVNGLARSRGASLLVSDSARTPDAAMQAFLAAIEVPMQVHRWGAAGKDNPYPGFLALADEFVVTADSMSMVAEAAYCARPLYLFSLDDGADWWRRAYNYRFNALVHRLAMKIGPQRMRRNVGDMLERLLRSGRAVWLGEQFESRVREQQPDASRRAALAVAALFAD